MVLSTVNLLLVAGFFQAAVCGTSRISARDGPSPSLPHDADVSTYCSWWVDYNSATPCSTLLNDNLINLESFRRWNPSVSADCGNLVVGKSYCVEALNEPAPGPTSSPSSSSLPSPTPSTLATSATTKQVIVSVSSKSSSTVSPTKTLPSNGVSTPMPTQPGMVDNCNKFHWIAKGVECSQVISYQKITLADFVKWNPTVKDDCSGMWAEVNVCVGVIGGTTVTPTATNPANGVQTPQPTQPGMVENCNKFHWIAKGVVCSQVISYQKILLADFVKWNPTVKEDCSGMWAEVNVCVGVIGGATATTAKPSTTAPGNGVQTPQPTQPGMVENCNKFHWIAKGVVCSQVISYQKITLADFVKWNPTVKSDCTGMWAEVNVCVGVIGGSNPPPTTTTTAGNGVQTPQPTQPGMVTNCKKFHYVAKGVVCDQIISYQKISREDFLRWNTGIKSDCSNMWAETHVCVGV